MQPIYHSRNRGFVDMLTGKIYLKSHKHYGLLRKSLNICITNLFRKSLNIRITNMLSLFKGGWGSKAACKVSYSVGPELSKSVQQMAVD